MLEPRVINYGERRIFAYAVIINCRRDAPRPKKPRRKGDDETRSPHHTEALHFLPVAVGGEEGGGRIRKPLARATQSLIVACEFVSRNFSEVDNFFAHPRQPQPFIHLRSPSPPPPPPPPPPPHHTPTPPSAPNFKFYIWLWRAPPTTYCPLPSRQKKLTCGRVEARFLRGFDPF